MKWLPAVVGLGMLAATAPGRGEPVPLLDARVTVDFGQDLGQRHGSLFELLDEEGRVVAGAGFPDGYNTRFRTDRQALQFFVRRPGAVPVPTWERLPRPDDDCGLYLFDLDGRLYAWNDTTGRGYRVWDPAAGAWRDDAAGGPLPASGDARLRLAGRLLELSGGEVRYDGAVLLPRPAGGRYHHLYYGQGRLVLYQNHREEDGGFTRLLSVPWQPGTPGPLPVEKGDLLPLTVLGETPFAFGQHERDVLTVSNYGGVYSTGPAGWRVVRPPSPGVSYQVYAAQRYYDALLLGQYPTGELFAYDGARLTHRPGWPPRLAGVSPSAREAQTLGVYGGELLAGVWPWAELWRRPPEGDAWHSMGRLFTHPEVTDRTVHPYEAEAARRGLVINHWGQRVTSMVPLGDSLYLATSAKGNWAWDPKNRFLSEEQRLEYGAVHRLRWPGVLTATVRWRNRPTTLRLRAWPDRLEIEQDGRTLAAVPQNVARIAPRGPLRARWGQGICGPLTGRLGRAEFSVARGSDF